MVSAGVFRYHGRHRGSWQIDTYVQVLLVAMLYLVWRVRVDVVDEGHPSGAGDVLAFLPADLSLPCSYSVYFCI